MTAKDLQYTAISISIVLLLIFSTVGCGVKPQNTDYGVFLSVTDDIDSLNAYDTVVIDAQYFDKAETVFSKILWDQDCFDTAAQEDRAYFQDYIERYAAKGADIYLLEYTRDNSLIREIREYCRKNGFHYYISDSLELD